MVGSSNPKSLIILPLKSQIPKFVTPSNPNSQKCLPLKSQIVLPLISQIPNLAPNITKLLGISNNYQHIMAFYMYMYMIPYNHDDKLSIYVCLKIISTNITRHFLTFITQNFDFYNLKFRSVILKAINCDSSYQI